MPRTAVFVLARNYEWGFAGLINRKAYCFIHPLNDPLIDWLIDWKGDFSGTLITEWDDGKAIWDRLTSEPGLLKQTALQLVEIAEHYGFDGNLEWIIDIK